MCDVAALRLMQARRYAAHAEGTRVPPDVRFYGQPFGDEETAGAFVREVLADPSIERLTIVVAWSRFGGLRRIKDDLQAFQQRGGRAILVTGIDEGVATRPGLALALGLLDEAYVMHDRSGRTFHPKLYFAEGPTIARAFVGSSNLTAGGLFWNYESGLRSDFALPDEEQAAGLVGIRDYISKLIDDEELCLRLTEDLLDALVSDRRYAVAGRERRSRRDPTKLPPGVGPEDIDQGDEEPEEGEALFGQSKHSKSSVPGLPAGASDELRELEVEDEEALAGSPTAAIGAAAPAASPATVPTAPAPATPTGATTAVESWDKVLRPTDAQHPPSAGTNPTGNLRLTKSTHNIDWLTYFRQVLFGPENWVQEHDRQGNPIETAAVPMRVTIDGTDHGTIAMRVDHAPHRESGQHNHATVLHWGPLMQVLTATDYTDDTVTLSRLSDGSYRLEISP